MKRPKFWNRYPWDFWKWMKGYHEGLVIKTTPYGHCCENPHRVWIDPSSKNGDIRICRNCGYEKKGVVIWHDEKAREVVDLGDK